jgi:proteic killer suppression protein
LVFAVTKTNLFADGKQFVAIRIAAHRSVQRRRIDQFGELPHFGYRLLTRRVRPLEDRVELGSSQHVEGKRVKRWVDIERPALRKLAQLDWSAVLDDLKIPPGNSLEALRNDRKGQHSIRINAQWRVCFVWAGDGAEEVEIVDYH